MKCAKNVISGLLVAVVALSFVLLSGPTRSASAGLPIHSQLFVLPLLLLRLENGIPLLFEVELKPGVSISRVV